MLVVGGTLAVLRWRNRPTTPDVDIYGGDAASWERAHNAALAAGARLGWGAYDWFNNRAASLIERDAAMRSWAALAFAPNARPTVVYHSCALILIAAPFSLQLTQKLRRLTGGALVGVQREADMLDALELVREVCAELRRPLRATEVLGWHELNPLGITWDVMAAVAVSTRVALRKMRIY